jgi:ATP-dependent RNA helicase DeaD
MVNFENIGFSPELKKAIKKMGYKQATEVQEKSIPLMVSGKNVVSKSFTGSGKTAAFGIALSERILKGESQAALILCPTRELASQVKEELERINSETDIKVAAIYGGTKMSADEKILSKRVDILCATPGRLLDHFKHRRLNPKTFDTVVLDEADRMLDMGFIKDIKHILSYIMPERTHLFSATLSGSVAKLIERFIPDYEEVMVAHEIVGKTLVQKKQPYSRQERFPKLMEWIKKAENGRILIFVATKRTADYLNEKLRGKGLRSTTIHGDKSQKAREASLEKFKEGRKKILIATDVAARGLQIDNVELVVNLDRARDADTHKHRIGRTGRMGKEGLAVTFIPKEDSDKGFWKDPGINYKQFPKRGGRRQGGPRGRTFAGRSPRGSPGHGPRGSPGHGPRDQFPRERKQYNDMYAGPHSSGPSHSAGPQSSGPSHRRSGPGPHGAGPRARRQKKGKRSNDYVYGN